MNMLDAFLEDGKIQGWSSWTLDNYRYNLQTFFDFVRKDPEEVDMDDLKGFLLYLDDERKVANPTIEKYFTAISSFYNFLEIEGKVQQNPVRRFRRRYLKNRRKNKTNTSKRQLISINEMRDLVNSILDPRDKAIVLLFAKTGIRLSELLSIDVDDINWSEQSIGIKPNGKRSNLTVYFDDECGRVLRRYMSVRDDLAKPDEQALFVCYHGRKMKRRMIESAVEKHAERIGLHDPDARDLQRRFTPHCCRHWFTTHLRRAGMPREYIKELRGDSRHETMDGYDHIDREELKMSYLAHIPKLGA